LRGRRKQAERYTIHPSSRALLPSLRGGSEQLMISGERSAHQDQLRPVCPLLIHREECRPLLGDDKDTIIASVGGEFELASHAGFNITEGHGHGKRAPADP